MSKIKETITDAVVDHYKDHYIHVHDGTPDPQCSECWTEFREHDCHLTEEDGCATCVKFASINT